VVEPTVPGGQAGTSSLIRNYLGFHLGVSGDELANRAVEQAWLFGAHLVLTQQAVALTTDGDRKIVTLSGGRVVAARAVVIATGVAWRRLGVPALEELVGAGVFYGAASAEARAMDGRDVYVVGAGNSAGQAAVHLAQYAAAVTLVVRGDSLASTMSEYLVTVLAGLPNVEVLTRTTVVDGGGDGYLDRLTLRDLDRGADRTVPASALFLLIGGEPRTDWLAGVVDRDDRGFLRTGHDLMRDGKPPEGWRPTRPPMLLETSVPGVFAAGDVRHRSTKRVAAAVGEGATAVQLVHEYLAEDRATDPAADPGGGPGGWPVENTGDAPPGPGTASAESRRQVGGA
jgi:thioredoxin reductase (NADPH)